MKTSFNQIFSTRPIIRVTHNSRLSNVHHEAQKRRHATIYLEADTGQNFLHGCGLLQVSALFPRREALLPAITTRKD